MLSAPSVPRIPRQVQRRSTSHKAMTIAVGVLANGGVVLAADRQLTIPNFWKGDAGKIMARAHNSPKAATGVLAITGATNIYEYLHGLGDELTRDFAKGLETADKDAAYERFGRVLRRFFRRHVFPVTGEQPDVQVLMAYQRGDQRALWQSSKNTLIEQYEYGAVGIGSFAANAWLGNLWKGPLDIPAAIVTAVFAAAVAKESVDGCGKYTDVLVVEAEQFRRISPDVVNEIDQLYEAHSTEIHPASILEYLGEAPLRQPRMSRDQVARRLADIRAVLRDSTPDTVKQWRAQRFQRLVAEQAQKSPKRDQKDQPPSQAGAQLIHGSNYTIRGRASRSFNLRGRN